MPLVRRLFLALAVLALVGAHAGPASAGRVGEIEHAPASLGFDLVVLRPVGLLATGIGAVLAVPATAFTAIIQPSRIREPIDFLVLRPARYTFRDPIGSH